MKMRKILITLPILVSLNVTFAIVQAGDIFLSFPDSDILGESENRHHMGEIEVLAFSWDLRSDPAKKSETSVEINEFSLSKYVDSSTAFLLTKAVIGENFGRAIVTLEKSNQDMHFDYLVLTLHDATVASISSEIDGGDDGKLVEQVLFRFSSISGVYTETNRDGSPGIKTEYLLEENKQR
jgi:type VI secretion system secreted protein Hcp